MEICVHLDIGRLHAERNEAFQREMLDKVEGRLFKIGEPVPMPVYSVVLVSCVVAYGEAAGRCLAWLGRQWIEGRTSYHFYGADAQYIVGNWV